LNPQANHSRRCIASQAVTQDASWSLLQVKNLPQGWRRNPIVRKAKIRMVEKIKKLKTDS
jgi:hypothetical protein